MLLKLPGYATKTLHPAYFAVVMGTGIMSIAFGLLGYPLLAYGLFLLNIVFYAVLTLMALARLIWFRRDFIADMNRPRTSWPYLTFVVGNNTLGAQFLLFHKAAFVAWTLWGVGLFSWAVLTYYIFFNLAARHNYEARDTIDGATLLVPVSTCSVALLGLRLVDALGDHGTAFLFGAWCFWAAAFILYLVIMTCIFYRKLSHSFAPQDWHGLYWICMGAMAIVTLTGAELAGQMEQHAGAWNSFIHPTIALSAVAWAIGTWWVPYQIIMDVWKLTHLKTDAPLWVRVFPWARLAFGRENHLYEPADWARVFPMGMYTACTLALARITGFSFLKNLSGLWCWLALLVWGLTLIGTLRAMRTGAQAQRAVF